MPYDFNWQDAEKTIIRFDIHGEVTWTLWDAAVEQVVEELGKTSHRVDLIFNDSVGMPKGNALPHLKVSTARLTSHPNMGLIVSVSTQKIGSFTKMMIGVLNRVYGIDMSHNGGFVASMDTALAIIATDRAKSKIRA